MATFEAAIPVLLAHEGGVGTVPGDLSGQTCYGWTQASCAAYGVEMPQDTEEASALYQKFYWNPLFSQLQSQTVGTKLFDDTVNQGPSVATKTLQRALCSVGSIVVVDGVLGRATIAASNLCPDELLVPWFRLHQYTTYDAWINADPVREADRKGLANRAAWPDPDGSIATQLLNATYRPPVPGGNLDAPIAPA